MEGGCAKKEMGKQERRADEEEDMKAEGERQDEWGNEEIEGAVGSLTTEDRFA
jgi:hypothetical protein